LATSKFSVSLAAAAVTDTTVHPLQCRLSSIDASRSAHTSR
jgi:hypothetical protein